MKTRVISLLFFLTVARATKFATSNNLFTSSVYKEAIKSGDENILISPLSAEIVLALAQSGARNATAEEIRTSLHLPNSNEETESSFKNLLKNLKNKPDYSLYTANKIYVGKNFPIKDEFKSTATGVYQSEIENIDFSQREEAVNKINQWVEEQTQNKIKNLVDSSVINDGTPTIFINTLYFKASWIDEDFHKSPIVKRNFHKSKSEVVQVEMMNHEAAMFNYYEDSELDATLVEVPFKGSEAFMVFVLPNEKDGLAQLEAKADRVFKKHPFAKTLVELNLPLFKIESTVDFKTILQQLGVKKAFVSGEADFSGIAGNKGDLAVGGVLQKTFINVNRDGVEAAAATDLWFYLSGPPRPNKIFTADHPFVFYIRVGDVILFAGRVISPSV